MVEDGQEDNESRTPEDVEYAEENSNVLEQQENDENLTDVKDQRIFRWLKITGIFLLFGCLITVITVPTMLTRSTKLETTTKVFFEETTTSSSENTTITLVTEPTTAASIATTIQSVLEDIALCEDLNGDLNYAYNNAKCDIYDEEPFESCSVGETGCYQFSTGTHCFKSVKSDTWWQWCALEFEWEPCYSNEYPDFTCDEITEMTTESTEFTTETFLDDYDYCKKLYTDVKYEYCCTFCDEPYEPCNPGQGCYRFGDYCYKSTKSDTWWKWCAAEVSSWESCDYNYYPDNKIRCEDGVCSNHTECGNF